MRPLQPLLLLLVALALGTAKVQADKAWSEWYWSKYDPAAGQAAGAAMLVSTAAA
jgi:hypothetical protein